MFNMTEKNLSHGTEKNISHGTTFPGYYPPFGPSTNSLLSFPTALHTTGRSTDGQPICYTCNQVGHFMPLSTQREQTPGFVLRKP